MADARKPTTVVRGGDDGWRALRIPGVFVVSGGCVFLVTLPKPVEILED
jgi:hypothetical protein